MRVFDFTFGFPEGTAQMLTDHDGWEAVWGLLAEEIRDGDDNGNNRFEVAARLNGRFRGEGPFWGLPRGVQIDGLLPRMPQHGWGRNLPPRRRRAEVRFPRAQDVWKLYYPGSVGSQTLTGDRQAGEVAAAA